MDVFICRRGRVDRATLRAFLEEQGFVLVDASAADEALARGSADVVILDPSSIPEPGEVAHGGNSRLRAALEAANVGLWDWDLQSGRVFYSREWKRQLGFEEHEIGGTVSEWESRAHPDDLERALETVAAYLDEPWPDYELEFRMRHKDGTYRWMLAHASLQHDEHGLPVRMLGSTIDITDRKQAQEAVRASEAHLRILSDAIPHLIWELTAGSSLRYANRAWHDYFGRESLEPEQWHEVVHPDDLRSVMAAHNFERAIAGEESLATVRLRRHDGVYRWFSHHVDPVRDADGELLYIVGSSTDIDELESTRVALDASRRQLVSALRAAGMGTWHWNASTDEVIVDDSLAELLGRDQAELEPTSLAEIMEMVVHPEDREAIDRAFAAALDEGIDAEFSIEWRVIRPDGGTQWLATKGRVERGPDDSIALVGASVDVTRSKGLEEQLRQAQKMEAIGMLAGGVAHDFNNILTVILARASMLEAHPELPAELAPQIEEIADAAERAASLTRRLLAFGRQQAMQKRELDLNVLTAEVLDMLRRLLGEQIECEFVPASGAVPINADPAMITQVLLNLALNARDAMPGGGRLTICTRVAAQWAHLSVSDTGCGIPPESLPHIFEPFFTTKGVGHGTGLGLATVYGIVSQHHGRIDVDTAVDRGTTVRVALPLASRRGRTELAAAQDSSDSGEALGSVPNTQSQNGVDTPKY